MAKKATSSSKKKSTSKIVKTQPVPNESLPGAFDLFKPSMDAFVLNIGVFLALYFIPLLIVMAGGLAALTLAIFAFSARSPEIVGMSGVLVLLALLVAIVVALLFAPAMPIAQIKSVRGEKLGLKETVKHGLPFVWRVLGLYIVMGLGIIVGLLLFIVPGVIFIQRYFLSIYFLVDKDTKVFEAMRRSAAATKNHWGPVWGVIGVTVLISLTGIVPYIGGIISAVLGALYYCAPAFRYEQLKKS